MNKRSAAIHSGVQPEPAWASEVLQGLAYWIGYSRAYYRHYHLLEAAITAELCNLLNAKINSGGENLYLCAEVPYRKLLSKKNQRSDDNRRLDLLITSKPEKNCANSDNFSKTGKIAIEVKRGDAPKSEITRDLRRLAELKSANSNLRTFLIIAGESKLPKQYAWFNRPKMKKGLQANRSVQSLPNSEKQPAIEFKVRRVCKAMATTAPKSLHTAMLVEVW